MARDIVSEAVEQAEAMKKAAYENAKSVLVDAMSTNLKQAVTEAIDEKIDAAAPEAVDSEEIQDEVATSDTDSIAEAGVEEEELELEASIEEDDVNEADEVIEIVDEIDLDEDVLAKLIEELTVDVSPQSDGWVGATQGEVDEASEQALAQERDSELAEENEELRKNVKDLEERVVKYSKRIRG